MTCFYNGTCIEIRDSDLYLTDSYNIVHKLDKSSYNSCWRDVNYYLDKEESRLGIEDRIEINKLIEKVTITNDYSDSINDILNGFSKLRMYALVRADIGIGHAINCVSHATISACYEWNDDVDFSRWIKYSNRLATCKVTKNQFEYAKTFSDYIVIKEDALNDTEVSIIFKPRNNWPSFFRKLDLFN